MNQHSGDKTTLYLPNTEKHLSFLFIFIFVNQGVK